MEPLRKEPVILDTRQLEWRARGRYRVAKTACDSISPSPFEDDFWKLLPIAMRLLREDGLPLVHCYINREISVRVSWYTFDFLGVDPDPRMDWGDALWRAGVPVTDEMVWRDHFGYFGREGITGYIAQNAELGWQRFQDGDYIR